MKKNSVWLVLVMALVLLSGSAQAAVPSEPLDADAYHVSDFAGVLTEEDRAKMEEWGRALELSTGAQVAAVVVAGFDGMAGDRYAYELFDTWSLGDAARNDGALLLLSVADREVRIEVGLGLDQAIDYVVQDQILDDYAIGPFSEGDFSTGMRDAYIALCSAVEAATGGNGQGSGNRGAQAVPPTQHNGRYDSGNPDTTSGRGFSMELVVLLIIFIIVISSISRLRPYRRHYHGGHRHARGWFWGWGHWGHRPHHRPHVGPRPPHGPVHRSAPPPRSPSPRPPASSARPSRPSGGLGGGSFKPGGGASRGGGAGRSFGGSFRPGGGKSGMGRGGSGKKF